MHLDARRKVVHADTDARVYTYRHAELSPPQCNKDDDDEATQVASDASKPPEENRPRKHSRVQTNAEVKFENSVPDVGGINVKDIAVVMNQGEE